MDVNNVGIIWRKDYMSVKRDLIGKRFGKLVVVSKTDKSCNRYVVWHCLCDCGNEIDVDTRKLKRGTVISCGCVPKEDARHGRKAEDLRGKVFGNLTVLSKVKSKNNKTRWLCKCTCGNEKIINSSDLKVGKVKSCGCLQHVKGKNIKDITNKRFGKLVALYPTGKRDYKLSVYWHCRCDCGNEVDVTQDCLVYGNYKSCGCLKQEYRTHIYTQLHHIDGTCVEWLANRKSRNDNKSGFRGVYMRENGQYYVSIGFKKKRFYLGQYKDYNEAVEIRKEAEEILHDQFVEAYKIWKESGKENKPLIYEVSKDNMTFTIVTNIDIDHRKLLDQVVIKDYVIGGRFNMYR